MATSVNDGLVAVEDAIAELVLAQELPDVFGWIELGGIRRQVQEADVVGDVQSAAGLMPACAVEHDDRMVAGPDVTADLGEVEVHGLAIRVGQDERGADVARGTDRPEQISPIVALIARGPRPAAALGPNAGQRALLTDAGFVLPPDLDRLALGMLRDAGCDQVGKVFLCASCAAAS